MLSAKAVTFQRESLRAAWADLLPLFHENHEETGALDQSEFQLDQKFYFQADEVGTLHLHTARHYGKFVGFGTYFVGSHPHYSSQTLAMQDAIFVQRKFRGFTAAKFLQWSEHELRKTGASVVIRQVTHKKDFTKVLERMGYQPEHITYIRRF